MISRSVSLQFLTSFDLWRKRELHYPKMFLSTIAEFKFSVYVCPCVMPVTTLVQCQSNLKAGQFKECLSHRLKKLFSKLMEAVSFLQNFQVDCLVIKGKDRAISTWKKKPKERIAVKSTQSLHFYTPFHVWWNSKYFLGRSDE